MNIDNDSLGAVIVPVPECGLFASWRGGSNVELFHDLSDLAPFEALDVWDYEHGCAQLEYRGDVRDIMYNIRRRVIDFFEE